MTTGERRPGDNWLSPPASVGSGAELEFVSATDEENLEDRLAYMGENPDISDGCDISFHLLRRLSSSVNHQKYHGVDIVSVNVTNPRTGCGREVRVATKGQGSRLVADLLKQVRVRIGDIMSAVSRRRTAEGEPSA